VAAAPSALAPRLCTECDNPVEGNRITCSDRCRKKRHARRRKTLPSRHSTPEAAEKATQELLREELRPLIRETITQDLLDSIHNLVGSLPDAIAAAIEDLNAKGSSPEVLDRRQRAYTLLMRHSVGNANLVPDINEGKRQALTVHFDLPRPGGLVHGEGGTETIQTKECDTCHAHKPIDDFVGSSDRCQVCFDRMRDAAKELLGA
jgi:hypothetical protein